MGCVKHWKIFDWDSSIRPYLGHGDHCDTTDSTEIIFEHNDKMDHIFRMNDAKYHIWKSTSTSQLQYAQLWCSLYILHVMQTKYTWE